MEKFSKSFWVCWQNCLQRRFWNASRCLFEWSTDMRRSVRKPLDGWSFEKKLLRSRKLKSLLKLARPEYRCAAKCCQNKHLRVWQKVNLAFFPTESYWMRTKSLEWRWNEFLPEGDNFTKKVASTSKLLASHEKFTWKIEVRNEYIKKLHKKFHTHVAAVSS